MQAKSKTAVNKKSASSILNLSATPQMVHKSKNKVLESFICKIDRKKKKKKNNLFSIQSFSFLKCNDRFSNEMETILKFA